MDAIHNIPHFLTAWDNFDENRLIYDLTRYDNKWADVWPLSLVWVYTETLEGRDVGDTPTTNKAPSRQGRN